MTVRYRGGHLGELVDDYVDGRLPECVSRRAAQHVAVCETCRAAIDAERHIVTQVRSVAVDPGRQATLMAGLLALGSQGESSATTGQPADHGSQEQGWRGPALVPETAPARYSSTARRPLLATAALAAVCGAALVTSVGHPRPAAPAAPTAADHMRSGDHLAAPVVAVGVRNPVGQASAPAMMRLQQTASGRMAP